MIRFFYGILWVTLQYALRVFYKRIKTVNSPKEIFGRTIYVSNHAASFMDPLVVASQRLPIVFFMTRSDVFTPITKPLLWAAHMLPIYRQHDGEDTKKKNQEVFEKCVKILSWGRNLLIFGEGFTDDVFVRRLKPIKKGAARIGFQTLESLNWEKKIYVAAVGCNYADPNQMRSDLLISTSDKFCLNDYKDEYLANPSKVITDVTKRIEGLMQEQITHVEDIHLCEAHEHVMMLQRDGMHPSAYNKDIPLTQRWKNSQSLAKKINALSASKKEELKSFGEKVKQYLEDLGKENLSENDIVKYEGSKSLNPIKHLIYTCILSPFALLGIVHGYLPYFLIKRFVEKSFRRKVFWGSVKMLLGYIVIGLINIPVIFLFTHFIYPDYWVAFSYYLLIGLFFLAFIYAKNHWNEFLRKGKINNNTIESFIEKRNALIAEKNQVLAD